MQREAPHNKEPDEYAWESWLEGRHSEDRTHVDCETEDSPDDDEEEVVANTNKHGSNYSTWQRVVDIRGGGVDTTGSGKRRRWRGGWRDSFRYRREGRRGGAAAA